ncbi:hypothetical protein OS493_007270 [Desmophyllum pertusum]|uniref:Uncharacterized protein n=1 Tax=Desmophyllum pertusum TaxID=174260 RepID=A0A9W9Z345_9CNID|nr:hypothetical protein OS493_007270 [Desmophyllum pertusum]
MSEQEFQAWLKGQNLSESTLQKYKIQKTVPKEGNKAPTKTIILPLSIENNATITGIAAVLEQFGQEFKIPCTHSKVVLPYDESLKTFNIEAARKHHKFLYLLQEQKNEMIQLEEQLTSIEKQLPDVEGETGEEDSDTEEESNAHNAVTFQKIDGKFKNIYDKLTDKMWQLMQQLLSSLSIPGSKQIADKLGLDNISTLIESCLAQEKEQDLAVWEMTELSTTEPSVVDNSPSPDDADMVYCRSTKNCKTLVVGDQGTNKITRSVKEKSSSAYGWAAENCLGDKKFQHQNLNRIDEAVRDVSMAYGLAAVQEFQGSGYFPSADALDAHHKVHGNHHDLLISSFKGLNELKWIEDQSRLLPFRYHSQLFTLFGPLRELYLSSVKFGDAGFDKTPVRSSRASRFSCRASNFLCSLPQRARA